MLVNTVDTLTN